MKLLILIPLILLAVIVGVGFFLQPVDNTGCGDTPSQDSGACSPVDAIVVVSGGDTNARTDGGIELYKNGWAPVIIFSGAALDPDSISNAAAMKERALAAGVRESAIVIEEDARTTQENAENTSTLFTQNQYERVILVTSGYHMRRATLEFERRTDSTEIINRPVLVDKDWHYLLWWVTPRGWWLAGGELVKITFTSAQGSVR